MFSMQVAILLQQRMPKERLAKTQIRVRTMEERRQSVLSI
jgi:hypothetical protein